MIFSLILGVILGALSVVFIAENTSLVTVTFLSWQFDGSLALVLLLTLICGMAIMILFLLPSFIRDTFYLSAVQKQKKEADKELAEARIKLAEAEVVSHEQKTVITERTAV